MSVYIPCHHCGTMVPLLFSRHPPAACPDCGKDMKELKFLLDEAFERHDRDSRGITAGRNSLDAGQSDQGKKLS